jgi:hypothetical protein
MEAALHLSAQLEWKGGWDRVGGSGVGEGATKGVDDKGRKGGGQNTREGEEEVCDEFVCGEKERVSKRGE